MLLLLGGLVTWRLTHMVVKELGPLGIFERLRAYLAKGQTTRGGLFDLISCMACASVYIGAVTAVLFAGDVFSWLVYTFAFSAITMIIEHFYTKVSLFPSPDYSSNNRPLGLNILKSPHEKAVLRDLSPKLHISGDGNRNIYPSA